LTIYCVMSRKNRPWKDCDGSCQMSMPREEHISILHAHYILIFTLRNREAWLSCCRSETDDLGKGRCWTGKHRPPSGRGARGVAGVSTRTYSKSPLYKPTSIHVLRRPPPSLIRHSVLRSYPNLVRVVFSYMNGMSKTHYCDGFPPSIRAAMLR
jgi:hypothetical protein